MSMQLAVVLVAPEIPPNTGNVIRLCANTGAALHLVEPLGFRMDDRELRRAGLDYHEYTSVAVHADWEACRERVDPHRQRRWLAFTTRGARSLYATSFRSDDVLVFGCETAGLPTTLLATFSADARVRIPMRPQVRSLNLSNAVAVAVYEAWRQTGFGGASG
jgi:tRNA (cytidine/uridine-2'-O-)-methyltransferase